MQTPKSAILSGVCRLSSNTSRRSAGSLGQTSSLIEYGLFSFLCCPLSFDRLTLLKPVYKVRLSHDTYSVEMK